MRLQTQRFMRVAGIGVLVLTAMLNAGCAFERPYVPPPLPRIEPYTEANYVVGQRVQATIGDPLIRIEEGTRYEGGGASISSFSVEFLYGGVAGSMIRMAYREFSNNMARPAFYQEVQYDLSLSKEIAFKRIRMRVLNATNESIEAEVIAGDVRNFQSATSVPAVPAGKGEGGTCGEKRNCAPGLYCIAYKCRQPSAQPTE